MITSRQKLILKAIIETYVKDAVPVGSKSLTQMPYLTFSSATLRYDMAVLEELGFLEKTHTSSGRIPSEKGYRYYVEHLVIRNEDVIDNYPLIDTIFRENRFTRDLALEKAIELLSELTNYTALAVGPSSDDSKIKKIDFIPLSNDEAVILIVTNKGHVQNQTFVIPDNISVDELRKVIKTLDELLFDRFLHEASRILKDQYAKSDVSEFMAYQEKLVESFIHAFSKFAKDNFYLSGLANMFDQPEFHEPSNVRRFVNMLDKKELVKVIGNQTGLSIVFGSDLEVLPMENTTLISIPYRISDSETGTLAILGPSRMEYSKVIPLLEYVASNIGKLYNKEGEDD